MEDERSDGHELERERGEIERGDRAGHRHEPQREVRVRVADEQRGREQRREEERPRERALPPVRVGEQPRERRRKGEREGGDGEREGRRFCGLMREAHAAQPRSLFLIP